MYLIYKMTNTKNGKFLYGITTKDLNSVKTQWRRNLRHKDYQNSSIVKDYNHFRKNYDIFIFEQIMLEEDKMRAQEICDSYILSDNTIEPMGYNRRLTSGKKPTVESVSGYTDVVLPKMTKKQEDFYEKHKDDDNIISVKENLSENEKTVLEKNMVDAYGIENLVSTENMDENFATPKVIDGLRQLADDLEKYGNINVMKIIPKKLKDELDGKGGNILSLLGSRQILNPNQEYVVFPSGHKQCTKCGKIKGTKSKEQFNYFIRPDGNFVTFDGRYSICRECIEKYCKNIYEYCHNALYTLISICQVVNVIFIQEVAQKSVEQWENNSDIPDNLFRYYNAILNNEFMRRKDAPTSLLEFRNSNFIGDIFSFEQYHPYTPTVFIKDLNQRLAKDKLKNDKDSMNAYELKWGKGFSLEEYQMMDEEYEKLEKYLTKKTELHYEALKKYIIYNSKEKIALAQGKDLKEVKEWSSLADKAAENAQLKVKQLTGDFGDGVNSFAQLVETVEEYDSVIPTLPKVKKLPYDDIDFLIWQVVNYIRRLEGKPEATYEDVYRFYDDELTKKMKDFGMTDEEIVKAKEERNAVFRDLADNYQEPLWLLPTLEDDNDDDDDEGGDGL